MNHTFQGFYFINLELKNNCQISSMILKIILEKNSKSYINIDHEH